MLLPCGRRAEDPESCSAPKAGELPAPGLRRSAGCSDRAAGAEDPGRPAAHPGPASCLLLGSGDLPGALIELPTSRIRNAYSASRAGELPAPGAPWDPPGSD